MDAPEPLSPQLESGSLSRRLRLAGPRRALARAARRLSGADTQDDAHAALRHVLALAPRFASAQSPEEVAAAVSREARVAFGADVVFIVRRLDADHVVVEHREPPSTMMPPGKTYPAAELPDLEAVLRSRELVASANPATIRIPITINAQTRRVLVLRWPREHTPREPELLVLQRFADQAGLALEHADRCRAEEDAVRNTKQTHRLLAVSAALTAARTVDDVAAALLAEGRAQTGADAATVLIAEGGSLRVLASMPPHGSAAEPIALTGAGRGPAITQAVRGNEVVLMESAAREQGFAQLPAHGAGLRYAASAAVPLAAGAAVVGGVELSFVEEREFSARDREFLAAFGRQGGLALERARLHAEEVRARQEAELRASAAQALEFIGEGVFMVDNEGLVRVWNPTAAAMTGVPAEDAVGRPVADVLPGWERFVERVPVATAGGRRTSPTTLPFESDHGELWLSVTGIRFDEGLVYAFRDVTDEHGLEQLKSDFIATISHELRTPLAVLYGGAVTLGRDDAGLPPEARQRMLEAMIGEGRRLERLIDRILFASRLESDAARDASALFDVADVVRDLVATFGDTIATRIELSVAPSAEDRLVLGNADHLRQIVSNLIDNALKYAPAGSPVGVTLELAESDLRIAVADEGIGIAHHDRERIFDKFYRADTQLAATVRGTGLGLYIVRELVMRMRGRVWVEPRAGGGSIFAVALPAEP